MGSGRVLGDEVCGCFVGFFVGVVRIGYIMIE